MFQRMKKHTHYTSNTHKSSMKPITIIKNVCCEPVSDVNYDREVKCHVKIECDLYANDKLASKICLIMVMCE